MGLQRYSMEKVILLLFGCLCFAEVANGGESCPYTRNGSSGTIFCEYGCCGTEAQRECCAYSVSTSVLVVACVVSGLVFIALVTAIIVCCVKKYKDKQESRVRELNHSQRRAHVVHVRRGPATVPKPPTYTAAPPAYSSEMPESHFRPITVTEQYIPYNQRFNTPYPTTTTTPRNVPGSQRVQASNQSFQTNTNRARQHVHVSTVTQPAARNTLFTGVTDEPPPPYREFERGRTPANRRRRFIQSPGRNARGERAAENAPANNAGASSTAGANTHPNVPLQTVHAAARNAAATRSGNVAEPPAVTRSSRIPTRAQNSTLSNNARSTSGVITSQNATTVATTVTVAASQRAAPSYASTVTSQNTRPTANFVTIPAVATEQHARPVITAAPQSSSAAPAPTPDPAPAPAPAPSRAPLERETQIPSTSGQQTEQAPSRTLALLHARIASRRQGSSISRTIRQGVNPDIDELACL